MSILAGSIATGAGGAVVAGMAAAKVAGAAGTAVAPGVGTALGIAGGFIGGAMGAKALKVAGDILHEDDAEILGRMFNAYVSLMIGEYLLDEKEIDVLIARLDQVDQKTFKTLFEHLHQASEQECVVRDFLNPHFEAVIAQRNRFHLPTTENIVDSIAELVEG